MLIKRKPSHNKTNRCTSSPPLSSTTPLPSTTSIGNNQDTTPNESLVVRPFLKRAGRLLAENMNLRSTDHCNKHNELCHTVEGKNSTCCNTECIDMSHDKHNGGACKKKCKFKSTFCRGWCVDLAYDKRNCGSCGNKCMPGSHCIYGVCNYT
ncbi:putative stigma-specific protein Stig1 [Helianthus anomalus]